MIPRMIARPKDEPVDLAGFIRHEKLDPDVEDLQDCQDKLLAATRAIELRTGRERFLEATYEVDYHQFPRGQWLVLPIPQVQSIVSMKYLGSDGELYTFPGTEFRLLGGYNPVDPDPDGANDAIAFTAFLTLRRNKAWPTVALEAGDAVTVRFIAGWRSPENVPDPLKKACYMRAGHLYRYRETAYVGRDQMRELVAGETELIKHYCSIQSTKTF